MTRLAVITTLLGLPIVLLAQTPLTDFARGARIQTDSGGIVRVLLPDDVYNTATRPDLGDVRVLNGAGEIVPHTLRAAPRPVNPNADWLTVPSFPMAEPPAGATAKTQVRVGPDGAVLEVTNDTKAAPGTAAYLIDVSAIAEPLTRLALEWTAAPDVTFLARVRVEASDDLNGWTAFVPLAAVAQLRRDTLTLAQNEIELPGHVRTKYLRVSWPKELAAVILTSARVRPRLADANAEIHWRTLPAQQVVSGGVAEYDTGALLPIQHLDLEFGDPTDAAAVTVRSRPSPSADWAVRHTGLFYAVADAQGTIRSLPARIGETADRYWSLETTREGGWQAQRAPRLKVGWHPHELIFLAQGAAPYILAYGSASVGAPDGTVDALLASMDEAERNRQIRPAALDEPRSLGGAAALTPSLPLRQITLWGVLIVAVAALALVAMRAFRDTNGAA